VAIARMVLRTKQYLVAIRPKHDVLCLETLLFADEVVPPESLEGLPGADTEVSDRELKMAQQLIESLSTDFEPEKYRDEYRDRVLALIEQKAEGQEIVAQPAVEEPAKVVDLMAALEASLAAAKANRAASE
jgi:DNA end-binding protein Ku